MRKVVFVTGNKGKFGEAKRRYSMNIIMGKLPETSESMIAMIILTMNIKRLLREISIAVFRFLSNHTFSLMLFSSLKKATVSE